jgi:hypothetical protein
MAIPVFFKKFLKNLIAETSKTQNFEYEVIMVNSNTHEMTPSVASWHAIIQRDGHS